jgi:FkbM family methyltransferase
MADFFSSLMSMPTTIRVLRPDEPVVIYGAGNTGRKVLRVLLKQGRKPLAFIDEFAETRSVEGIPVFALADTMLPRNATVIVAIFNREKNARFSNIECNLLAAGYSSIRSFEQFFISCPEDFEETFFWLANPDYLKDRVDEVRAADVLWSDARSRNIYRSQIRHRITGDHVGLPEPEPEVQYTPRDVPLLPEPYRFVDVGAFDGDTLDALHKQNVRLESVLAFEPDMRNFQSLVKRVRAHGPYAHQMILLPCGVGRSCGSAVFLEDGTESSKALKDASPSPGNRTRVPVVSLDEVLFGFRPNYIKFDVEGFEEEALYGMRNTIKENHPMLAVSVYHRPDDLFHLPLLISFWGCPADYYLRMHGEHTFDTVLYMIPRRRPNE